MNELNDRIRATLASADDDRILADTILGVLDECERLGAHGDARVDAITRNIRNVIAAELGIVPGETSVPVALTSTACDVGKVAQELERLAHQWEGWQSIGLEQGFAEGVTTCIERVRNRASELRGEG